MKALALLKNAKIEYNPFKILDVNLPDLNSNEILVRVTEVGLCKLDIDLIEGNFLSFGFPSKFPLIIGHEIIGKVEDIGENVNFFKKYESVAIGLIYSSCLRCKNCLNGKENFCDKLQITGFSSDGGLSQYFKINESFAFNIPNEINIDALSLICNGSFAYKCAKIINRYNVEKVGIFGSDLTAQILSQILKYYGIEVHLVISKSEPIPEYKFYDSLEYANNLKQNYFDAAVVLSNNFEFMDKAVLAVKRGSNVILAALGIVKVPAFLEGKSFILPGLPTRSDIIELMNFCKSRKFQVDKEEINFSNITDGLKAIKYKRTNKKIYINLQKSFL